MKKEIKEGFIFYLDRIRENMMSLGNGFSLRF